MNNVQPKMSHATRADDDLAYVKAGIGADLDTVLVFNLLRTHSYLNPFLDAGLRQDHLTSSQLNALLVLRTAGADGLLMGEIGQKLVVTKSNVTGLVDRLERQGLVVRAEHHDRRATMVRLTQAGAELLERTAPRHAELLAELAGCLTGEEKQTLIRILTKLRRELRLRGRREEP
jgi:MarR family 2-MHQ and catechol resistance regulon transcriptional repressor